MNVSGKRARKYHQKASRVYAFRKFLENLFWIQTPRCTERTPSHTQKPECSIRNITSLFPVWVLGFQSAFKAFDSWPTQSGWPTGDKPDSLESEIQTLWNSPSKSNGWSQTVWVSSGLVSTQTKLAVISSSGEGTEPNGFGKLPWWKFQKHRVRLLMAWAFEISISSKKKNCLLL